MWSGPVTSKDTGRDISYLKHLRRDYIYRDSDNLGEENNTDKIVSKWIFAMLA